MTALLAAILLKKHKLGDATWMQTTQVLYTHAACSTIQPSSYQRVGLSPRQQEVQYLADRLTCVHPLAFRVISEPMFRAGVRDLLGRVDAMTDDEYIVALLRILAMIGDAHTFLSPGPRGWHFYPFALQWFPDGFRISASSAHLNFRGWRVLAINDHPIDKVYRDALPLMPRENDIRARSRADRFLLWYE